MKDKTKKKERESQRGVFTKEDFRDVKGYSPFVIVVDGNDLFLFPIYFQGQ
jgi:hypothetical protein